MYIVRLLQVLNPFVRIACGAKFIFNAANHALGSLSTYPFPIFFEEWGLPTDTDSIAQAWDNHGDIVVGNDVWIGYEAVILSGVTIGDGMVIGTSAIVDTEIDGAVGMNSGIFNNPFLIWGKYHKGLFRTTLTLSFQFHHTQMDGAHAGRFLKVLQDNITDLKLEKNK